MLQIYGYDPAKKEKIIAGEITEVYFPEHNGAVEKVFEKRVKSNHFVKTKQAYGISCDIIDQLVEHGVTTVVLKTPAWNYTSDIHWWLNRDAIDDIGNGRQVFVPVHFMKQTATKETHGK